MTATILEYDFDSLPFQSLFWWISYCDPCWISLHLDLQRCFNPCFGGSHIVTSNGIHDGYTISGFNPCFGGSHIVTSSFFRGLFSYIMFQSLFWWISYCDVSLSFRRLLIC